MTTSKWIGRIAGFLFLGLALTAGPARAQSETGNNCVRDYRPGAVCTSNDVRLEELTVVSVIEDCASGVPGEAEVVFQALISALGSPDRYDIGLFLALDGGSARNGDSCYHDFLNPPLTPTPVYGDFDSDGDPDIVDGPWWDGEPGADACGDLETNTEVFKTLAPIRVACLDSNGDGSADVSVCTSWDNQSDDNCSDVTDAYPGTNAKCSCPDPIELGTPPDPALTVTKSPDVQTVLAGGTATFTIVVESNTFLSNVVVSDPQCTTLTGPVGDDGDQILETFETWTYTCTVDPVTASFTNTVTVDADSPNGPVSDSDTADVVVESPSLSVAKTPDTQTVNPGGSAVFTITVDNTGNVDLTNVVVTDPQCTTLTGPTGDGVVVGVLETTETWSYTCTVTNVLAGFVNTATVSATPPTGPDVGGSDTATVSINAPSITVEKNPPTQSVLAGGSAVFTITVDNSGDEDLDFVEVTDPQCTTLTGPTGDGGVPGVLETTETWTYTCTVTNVQADFTNTVTVEGDYCGDGCIVTDTDTADVTVEHPAMTVSKTPATQTVVSGGSASFTITVDNTGDVPLTEVVVDDPLCAPLTGPAGDDGDLVLGVDETWTYTCSTANVTADFTNTVSVTATPPTGPDLGGGDTADVTVVAPVVTAEKTSTLTGDNDGNGVLSPGDDLRYTIVIVNSGTGDATGVVFADTPDPNTALAVGSVTTTQGSVTTGNTAGDVDVEVAIGTLAAGGGSATVEFTVRIADPFPIGVAGVLNQGVVTGDGIPDVPTDDPDTPADDDPTGDPVTPPVAPPVEEIPTLGAGGAALLGFALALAAFVALRRRPRTAG